MNLPKLSLSLFYNKEFFDVQRKYQVVMIYLFIKAPFSLGKRWKKSFSLHRLNFPHINLSRTVFNGYRIRSVTWMSCLKSQRRSGSESSQSFANISYHVIAFTDIYVRSSAFKLLSQCIILYCFHMNCFGLCNHNSLPLTI